MYFLEIFRHLVGHRSIKRVKGCCITNRKLLTFLFIEEQFRLLHHLSIHLTSPHNNSEFYFSDDLGNEVIGYDDNLSSDEDDLSSDDDY